MGKWICEGCASALKIAWRKYAACAYTNGTCGQCKRLCPRDERREYHIIPKLGDYW